MQACADVLPHAELSVGMHRIDAEVAATEESRMVGLMYRKSMPETRGMLFVFDVPASHCMWMKNTLIPLSVAFIDDGGRIVNIEEMAAETEESHCAAAPVRFALEMNRGWFQARGLKKGARLSGLPRPH
ncbi:hypothetical protein GCM10025771_24190 [Niveibacterium umoris]|uniref:DUF192 domain-containing protein n=1 Tax=Niveibacterium umoris TaxID=1193620 RepID=A0A840BJ64_9RHOO|nr:DUF192 domain-containing protein [Niveibacterium umoris]MBB4012394.1 hypothetical protein [Niveibacterium umoris]